ncbi:hypothetical protein SAMN05428939_0712 [Streptomyces sp. TLI_105]|nr:hypothetical protein SAMN05428939_0712 [Streptomyces sp. TLI_105]
MDEWAWSDTADRTRSYGPGPRPRRAVSRAVTRAERFPAEPPETDLRVGDQRARQGRGGAGRQSNRLPGAGARSPAQLWGVLFVRRTEPVVR